MPDAIYTVQPADEAEGLMGVARRLYGDASRWPEIFEANQMVIGHNPSVIRAGQQLVIAMPDAKRQTDGMHSYVVQTMDVYEGLRGIARRLYGNADRWVEIYALNRGVVGDDPAYLQPGQTLIIPFNGAIEH